MSDFDSSLPVRTQNPGDVIAKIADATTPSQQLAVDAAGKIEVKLDDAAGNGITSQVNGAQRALDVGIDVAGVQIDPRDQGAPNSSANGWPVMVTDGTDTMLVNADGSINITDNGGIITVDGTVNVSNLPATVDTDYGAVGASTIRTASEIGNATGAASFDYGAVSAQTLRTASQIGNATGAADFNAGATGAQTLRTTSNQGTPGLVANAWPTLVTDGTDTMLVNTDGSINVVIADATPGTPINDLKSAAAIAAGASDNHDYTVTAAKTFYLNQVEAAGSGKAKMVVSIETGVASGVFTSRFVQFNSTANTNMSVHLDNPIAVAAGVKVRIVMTNKDLLAQDLYSTISGYELP